MYVDWEDVLKNTLKAVFLMVICICSILGFGYFGASAEDVGVEFFFACASFLGLVVSGFILVRKGIFLVADIRDEFMLDNGDAFGIVESFIFSFSVLCTLILWKPKHIDVINDKFLSLFNLKMPHIPIDNILFWLFLLITIGLTVFQLIKAKLYFFITYFFMFICGLTLVCSLMSAIILIFLAVRLTIKVAIGLFVCFLVYCYFSSASSSGSKSTYSTESQGNLASFYYTGNDESNEYRCTDCGGYVVLTDSKGNTVNVYRTSDGYREVLRDDNGKLYYPK